MRSEVAQEGVVLGELQRAQSVEVAAQRLGGQVVGQLDQQHQALRGADEGPHLGAQSRHGPRAAEVLQRLLEGPALVRRQQLLGQVLQHRLAAFWP